MATFNQVFWYTNGCPLRQIDEPALIEESPKCKKVRELVHDSLLTLMCGKITPEKALVYVINQMSAKKPSRADKLSDGDNMIVANLAHSALWAAGTWNKYLGIKKEDIIDTNCKFTSNNMEANVDIVRFKRYSDVSYLNLTWIVYNMDMPNKEERGRLFQYMQYNARAYELATESRPTQLDVFFPFLNHTFHFLYNPETSYEIVANLIDSEKFYGVPSEACNFCQMCPMDWNLSGRERKQ